MQDILTRKQLYYRWKGMKQRCYNQNAEKYNIYGKRGIIVCDEWYKNFQSFYTWAINNGYKKNLSLDRIDVNGNYEPSNCRWATNSTQMRNTQKIRKNNKTGFRGVSFKKEKKQYMSYIGIMGKTIYLGYFKCRLAAAYAYDEFIIKNNLEHTRNFE